MPKKALTDEPRYAHDCEQCVFLGTQGRFDLYFCTANPTVIAREGNDENYISGLALAAHIPSLATATVRAINAGLLTTESITAITNP